MDYRGFSVGFSKDVFTYTLNNSFQVENIDVGNSVNILETIFFNSQNSSFITDFVKSSTGGVFYGKISYDIQETDFEGNQIPTANWVLTKILSSGSNNFDFNALFDDRFSTKRIEDLAERSHSMLTDVFGSGSFHLSLDEYNNIKQPASLYNNGYLTKNDYQIFYNKQNSLSVSTGIILSNNTLSLDLNTIDHNLLKNYEADRHYKCNDTLIQNNIVWSSFKIVEYINENIPSQIVDYVSSNGGVFNGVISYSNLLEITNDLDIIYKKYLVDYVTNNTNEIFTELSGTGNNSIKYILNSLSLTDLGIRNHNDLLNISGDNLEELYHLTLQQFNRVKFPASETTDGYLTKEDWNTFNSKLGSFDVNIDLEQSTFLRYGNGIMYYNPNIIDHNNLYNYDESRHPQLNDEETTTSNVWSASKIMSMLTGNDFQSYRINLKSGATVEQRLIGLIEGEDYPTGWGLAADGTSLVITHNLNKIVSIISIYSVNGITNDAVKLEGNVAYSTLTNVYYNGGYNRIKLDAFATITTNLIIKIIL